MENVQRESRGDVILLRLVAGPLNTLTPTVLDELCRAVEKAAGERAAGIVIAGRHDHFSAGADIHLFESIGTSEEAERLCRLFQEAFQQIEDSPIPVAAALAGSVLGGALELALACHYRIAAEGTQCSMPEVRLGINPGAGGTQRLPRLVGPDRALAMLLSAESVPADQARQWGLVDEVCKAESLIDHACRWVVGKTPRPTGALTERLSADDDWNEATANLPSLLGRHHPEIPAPKKIVELVKACREKPLVEGLAHERNAFAACMASRAARHKIRFFFATRRTGRLEREPDKPLPLPERVGVVGLGTMGSGIALAFLQSGFPVVAADCDQAALERGRQRIEESLQRRVRQGRMSDDQCKSMLSRLTTATDWSELAGAGCVVESVFEDVKVKQAVLAEVERVVASDGILATNTSTISLDELAAGLTDPGRLLGLHFFNPAQRMRLVEVIHHKQTRLDVLDAGVRLARKLGKTPVIVANREGFVVNRIFVPYLQEAFALLEDGAEPEAIDRAAVEFGFPMGPLVLIDMAGLDILVHAQRVLERAFPRHGKLSSIATGLVEQGHLGQKTGQGVYGYEREDRRPRASDVTSALIAAARSDRDVVRQNWTSEAIVERLVLRMVGEAYYVMEEKLVPRPEDVDVAMLLGTGFPDFRGGLFGYAQDLGLDRVRQRLDALADQWGPRFCPSPQMKAFNEH